MPRKGIKPIIGSEVNVQGKDFNYQLILLAKTWLAIGRFAIGLVAHMCKIKFWMCRISKRKWLQESLNKDVVLLSGGAFGDLAEFIKQRNYAAAKAQVLRWKEIFADDYFIELHRTEKHYDDDFFNACFYNWLVMLCCSGSNTSSSILLHQMIISHMRCECVLPMVQCLMMVIVCLNMVLINISNQCRKWANYSAILPTALHNSVEIAKSVIWKLLWANIFSLILQHQIINL